MENVRENVSVQLSGMSVVQGLVVQDKFLFWQHLPLNNFYFHSGQRDHYFLGEPHFLTQRLPTSLPLFSSSLLSSYFTTSSPSLETETCVVFWNAYVKKLEAGGGNL